MAHLNVRSLLSSIDDVVSLISHDNVDILTFSETWLDETINDSELCPIDGYNVIRRDRNRLGEELQ